MSENRKTQNRKNKKKWKTEKTEDRKTTENQTLGLSFTKSWGSALWFLASPSEKAETEKPENRKTDKPKTWVKFHRELSIRTIGKNKNLGKASQPASAPKCVQHFLPFRVSEGTFGTPMRKPPD